MTVVTSFSWSLMPTLWQSSRMRWTNNWFNIFKYMVEREIFRSAFRCVCEVSSNDRRRNRLCLLCDSRRRWWQIRSLNEYHSSRHLYRESRNTTTTGPQPWRWLNVVEMSRHRRTITESNGARLKRIRWRYSWRTWWCIRWQTRRRVRICSVPRRRHFRNHMNVFIINDTSK